MNENRFVSYKIIQYNYQITKRTEYIDKKIVIKARKKYKKKYRCFFQINLLFLLIYKFQIQLQNSMDNKNTLTLRKQWFIKAKSTNIEDQYQLDLKKPLGSGAFGVVLRGRLKGSGNTSWRAIKKIPKKKVKDPSELVNQIEILQKLDHPHIIKLYQTFQDPRNIYIVTELCTGGQLFDKIIEKGTFSQEEARITFKQIMLALNYCHSMNIAHRDLKPQNFLLLNKDANSPIKLIDFGLSFKFGAQKKKQPFKGMGTLVGTSYYMAPEVMTGKYDQSCDIWSAGVILYILVSSVPPFNGETDQQILEQVRTMKYTFDIPEMKNVSNSLKDLISKMLVDPSKRPNAQQVLNHPWLNTKSSTQPLKLNIKGMKNFCNFTKLKKVAVTLIATQLQQNDIIQLGQTFEQIDKNGDGVLTIQQLNQALITQGEKTNIAQIKKILDLIDTDHNGSINYTEFIAGCLQQSVIQKEQNILMAFRMLDIDGNGKVSRPQLQQLLQKQQYNLNTKALDDLIKQCDKNGDGEIDYRQFSEMMSNFKL